MYPNQPVPPPSQPPQQPQQSGQPPVVPLNYLDQIAPQTQKKRLFDSGPKKLIIILAAAFLVVMTLVVIVNVIAGANRKPAEQLAARLISTQQIADNAQENLKTTSLRSLNSTLRVYFTNTNRDIAQPFATIDINPTKVSGSVASEEAALTSATEERLEDARLNAVFDRTYAREMEYQLATLLALMEQVYSSTGSGTLKEYLEESYDNLEPLHEQFAAFDET